MKWTDSQRSVDVGAFPEPVTARARRPRPLRAREVHEVELAEGVGLTPRVLRDLVLRELDREDEVATRRVGVHVGGPHHTVLDRREDDALHLRHAPHLHPRLALHVHLKEASA